MAVDAYDPDTGFTVDVQYEADMSGSMLWRFSCGSKISETRFRFEPMDALMEAPSDAWLLQWQREDGSDAGEVVSAPMLRQLADDMAYAASQTKDAHNADWARHWATAAELSNALVGARGAVRHCREAVKEEGEPWLRGFLHDAFSKARGSLR